ncbi:MAG: flagellar protein FlgN [Polaromonas sp.]
MSNQYLKDLVQEHAAIAAFVELLDQEAEAMTLGQFASLPQLAERKSLMADQIALLGRQRENEQMRLGYRADRHGADAAAEAGGAALQNAWNQLRESAAQAHERNHRNGVMIHSHLDFTRQSISFLKASGKPLYGPDGTHHTGVGSGNKLAMG